MLLPVLKAPHGKLVTICDSLCIINGTAKESSILSQGMRRV